MAELFNQDLKSTFGASDRMAVGVPGQSGCDNVLISVLIEAIRQEAAGFLAGTFDNSNLSGNVWSFNHGKNTAYIDLILYNGDGVKEGVDGILTVDDLNNISIDFGGEITGTYTFILKYFNT